MEMAPQVLEHPGTVAHSHQRRNAVDKRILAHHARPSPTDQEHEDSEDRNCFYCLEGWVFLGSLDHDGEEIVEAIRCKRCDGRSVLKRS